MVKTLPITRRNREASAPVEPQHDLPSQTIAALNVETGDDLLAIASPSNRFAAKQTLLATVATSLSEADKLWQGDKAAASKATTLASTAALSLVEAQVANVISPEEVTELLAKQFGWRKKGDSKSKAANMAERSKTPFGQGEVIRTRINRMVKAYGYATGDSAPDNFFRVFDRSEVAEYLDELKTRSIFTVFDDMTAFRKELLASDDDNQPVAAVFDPIKVAKIVTQLSEAGAVQQFADNVALIQAYAAVVEVVKHITSELMARPDASDIIARLQGRAVSADTEETEEPADEAETEETEAAAA